MIRRGLPPDLARRPAAEQWIDRLRHALEWGSEVDGPLVEERGRLALGQSLTAASRPSKSCAQGPQARRWAAMPG